MFFVAERVDAQIPGTHVAIKEKVKATLVPHLINVVYLLSLYNSKYEINLFKFGRTNLRHLKTASQILR